MERQKRANDGRGDRPNAKVSRRTDIPSDFLDWVRSQKPKQKPKRVPEPPMKVELEDMNNSALEERKFIPMVLNQNVVELKPDIAEPVQKNTELQDAKVELDQENVELEHNNDRGMQDNTAQEFKTVLIESQDTTTPSILTDKPSTTPVVHQRLSMIHNGTINANFVLEKFSASLTSWKSRIHTEISQLNEEARITAGEQDKAALEKFLSTMQLPERGIEEFKSGDVMNGNDGIEQASTSSASGQEIEPIPNKPETQDEVVWIQNYTWTKGQDNVKPGQKIVRLKVFNIVAKEGVIDSESEEQTNQGNVEPEQNNDNLEQDNSSQEVQNKTVSEEDTPSSSTPAENPSASPIVNEQLPNVHNGTINARFLLETFHNTLQLLNSPFLEEVSQQTLQALNTAGEEDRVVLDKIRSVLSHQLPVLAGNGLPSEDWNLEHSLGVRVTAFHVASFIKAINSPILDGQYKYCNKLVNRKTHSDVRIPGEVVTEVFLSILKTFTTFIRDTDN